MQDWLDLDSVPVEEDCIQVGHPGQREEVRRYRDLLNQLWRDKLIGSMRFELATNYHDAGVYYSIKIIFNDQDERQVNLAYDIENNIPLTWDLNKEMKRLRENT